MADRLSLAGPAQPRIDPRLVGAGILHIGLGAFHRAHQAVFTEDAIASGGGDWGIIAVAPRSTTTIDVLREQDHLFSVTTQADAGCDIRVVGAVVGTRHLPTEGADVLAAFSDPDIRVVTLTVTEKAYRYDLAADGVQADLAGTAPPRTVPGLLVRGLRRRAAAGGPPIAILSCDNLPGNGARVRELVCAVNGAPFGDWVTFPSSMVDRIVPASTQSTLDYAERALGARDLAAVAAEPYSQWVIEDDFPGGRPPWQLAGAVLTDDVTAWERLKLRVLNGVHSTAAYLGALAGCTTIADTLALPGLSDLLRRMITEDIAPTIAPPDGVTVSDYGDSVLRRFHNSRIEHRTIQIAMDGSQKLPQRLVGTLVDLGRAPSVLGLGLAAWMRFVGGTADNGSPLPLDDPLAATIRATLASGTDPVTDLLGLREIFPPSLLDDAAVVASLREWYTSLARHGAAETVRRAAA